MRVHLPLLLFAWALAGCQWVPQLTPGAVACDDGRTNGAETDVDCGGNCAQCGDGRVCLRDVDCASHVCVASHCAAPSCADGVINGTETDVDCGGGCAPCADQQRCSVATDCVSGACGDGLCGAGSCSDLAKNGDETDIDCGGHCAPCAAGTFSADPRVACLPCTGNTWQPHTGGTACAECKGGRTVNGDHTACA